MPSYCYALNIASGMLIHLCLTVIWHWKTRKESNYYIGQVDCLGWLSITTAQTGNLPKALEFGYEALRIANEKHLENYIARSAEWFG